MEKNLTEGRVLKTILLFALPILGANLLQAMYGTVDLMIVGLFTDKCEVSAVSTGSMTLQTITGVVIGLTMGCTVLLGQKIGMRDKKGAAHTVASSAALFVAVGILLTIVIALMATPIASVMNAPEEAFAQTAGYIRICGFGIICIVLFNSISGIFRGIGDSKTPFILMAVACVCNIIGDLLLVGKMNLGSAGAAIATVAAQDALTGVSFMMILAILNQFGVIASAGVGVAEKLCGLMFIVPGAMMAAVSAFSAQNVGAGNVTRAKQGMYISMVFTVVVGLCMFAVSFTNGVWLSGFFSRDPEVCIASADYLRSYSIDCVIVGLNFSMMGYLNGHDQTLFVALQGILSTFLVRIPVSYFMSKIPGVSLFQVGFATPLATVFAIVITVLYLFWLSKRQKKNLNFG